LKQFLGNIKNSPIPGLLCQCFYNTRNFASVNGRGNNHTFSLNIIMGRGAFFHVGEHKCTSNNYRKFLWFELSIVSSQALKYDVTTYTPYEGLNCTIWDKITPLWKRIDEPPEIQMCCYSREDPGQQRHSNSSHNLFQLH